MIISVTNISTVWWYKLFPNSNCSCLICIIMFNWGSKNSLVAVVVRHRKLSSATYIKNFCGITVNVQGYAVVFWWTWSYGLQKVDICNVELNITVRVYEYLRTNTTTSAPGYWVVENYAPENTYQGQGKKMRSCCKTGKSLTWETATPLYSIRTVGNANFPYWKNLLRTVGGYIKFFWTASGRISSSFKCEFILTCPIGIERKTLSDTMAWERMRSGCFLFIDPGAVSLV